jgi:hypothetical protein
MISTLQGAGQTLIKAVNSLVNSQGGLTSGQANSLTSKIQAGIIQLDKGNGTAARNQFNAFIDEVTGYVNAQHLTAAQGKPLIDVANNIIADIQ